MEKESMSATYLSFPKLGNKENSTYYKTFYSRNPNKRKPLSTKKMISSKTTKNMLPRNSEFTSFAKYNHQLPKNKHSRNRRAKYTSLRRNKNSFSSADTDDTFFALSEIKSIDHKISRRINKGFLWKEKPNNIYDMCTNQNKKDIENVKMGVRYYGGGDDFDLRAEIDKKKYFPVEKVDIINEAKEIMNKMKKSIANQKKVYEALGSRNKMDLKTFVMQNRHIYKKNYVLELIRDERIKLKSKEKEISKALEDANKIYKKDEEAFDSFMEIKRKEFKETDARMEAAVRRKKIAIEKFKDCYSERHFLENEIEKNIRGIIQYKKYADFIHKLLGKDEINVDLTNIQNNLESKKRDLVYLAKTSIREFKFLLEEDELAVNNEDISNSYLLTNLFFGIEANIIQQMDKREEFIKERFRMKREFEKELITLRKKRDEEESLLISLSKELENEKSNYSQFKYQEMIDEARRLIFKLNHFLNKAPLSPRGGSKPLDIAIRNLLETIHKVENRVNNLYQEMIKIQGDEKKPDELFKRIVEKLKIKNKAIKHQEGLQALNELKEKKNLKYLQRMNRYKVRGPIVYPPPWVLKNKIQDLDQNKNDDDEEEDMIFYD